MICTLEYNYYYYSTFTDSWYSWFLCFPRFQYFSFLQVWIHNIGLGSLVYSVEKICDDSGEDPTCSRSAISLRWKNTADALLSFLFFLFTFNFWELFILSYISVGIQVGKWN
jgi:hypothetical protein